MSATKKRHAVRVIKGRWYNTRSGQFAYVRRILKAAPQRRWRVSADHRLESGALLTLTHRMDGTWASNGLPSKYDLVRLVRKPRGFNVIAPK